MRRRGGDVFARRSRNIGRMIALGVAIFIALCAIFTVIDDGRVIVRTQKVLVPDLPKALEGFTVLHISDLSGIRFGPNQKVIQGALKSKKYNAVCLTGDMVGKRGDAHPLMELLAALDTTKPVFFIAGDSDPAPVGSQASGYYTVLADWVSSAQTRGATFLDAPASMTVGGATVWFSDASQLSLDLDTAETAYANSNTREGTYYADAIMRTKIARQQMSDTNLHITLSHNPVGSDMVLNMLNMADSDGNAFLRTVDLILSGGTVGGQWRLPLIGPVFAGTWFPGSSMPQGYYRSGSLLQYTSAGLGTSGICPLPAFRLFNTPEITLITFTSQLGDDVEFI